MSLDQLNSQFKKYDEWERGVSSPTFGQLETLANKLNVPIGYLFLREPPEEKPPIPDFRRTNATVGKYSSALLDTIYICQRRQNWYREYLTSLDTPFRSFVGSCTLETDHRVAAVAIRKQIGVSLDSARREGSWTDFLRTLIKMTRSAGILVMISSIVGNNTSRKLSVQEFRGFSLVDRLAPLVFVNAGDAKSAQIFTLAHEIAHIWLGLGGVSQETISASKRDDKGVELWCNRVAAEVLVPEEEVHQFFGAAQIADDKDQIMLSAERIARSFKVSQLVALRRLYDLGLISEGSFQTLFRIEMEANRKADAKGSGGDFYNNLNVRVDPQFASALISSTFEGRTLVGDALSLLSLNSTKALKEEARRLGVAK